MVPAGASVLDLGCDTGVPTAKILTESNHRVVGVDISAGMLQLARQQVPAAEFVQADLRDVPTELGNFAAVTAFFSLLMLSKADIEQTIEKIVARLEPSGYFAISMVNFDADSLPVEFLGVPVTVSGYLQADLAKVLESHGLTVLEIETVDFSPANGPTESQIFALAQRSA